MALLALNLVPIYEFRCPKGHQFETFHKMADPDPEVCEVCGKGPLVKVLHPVPVHFKGSGFYSTDYGRKGRPRDSSDSDGAKKDESKDVKKIEKSDKSDKKPAAKES
jgi:putative FmdB family regulatory protein